MKKILLSTIVVAVFGLGFVIYNFSHPHVSDEVMIKNFQEHRNEFENLLESDARMAELGVSSINQGFNGYKSDLITYLEVSSQVFMTDHIGRGVIGNTQGQSIDSDTQLFFRPIGGSWYVFLMYTFY